MGDYKPTDAELEILQILWESGPSSVRSVNEKINLSKSNVGYTTTLKIMQIMAEKGLLTRDTTKRQHIYSAAMPRETIEKGVVKKVIERVFQGSAKGLIMQALNQEKTTAVELKEIKSLIEKIERQQDKS